MIGKCAPPGKWKLRHARWNSKSKLSISWETRPDPTFTRVEPAWLTCQVHSPAPGERLEDRCRAGSSPAAPVTLFAALRGRPMRHSASLCGSTRVRRFLSQVVGFPAASTRLKCALPLSLSLCVMTKAHSASHSCRKKREDGQRGAPLHLLLYLSIYLGAFTLLSAANMISQDGFPFTLFCLNELNTLFFFFFLLFPIDPSFFPFQYWSVCLCLCRL